MRTPVAITFAVIVVLLGLFAVSCRPSSAGIAVTVNNGSGGEITNLQITFTGGTRSSAILKPSELFQTRVNPSGSSHLSVEFIDSNGKQHSNNVDVYFERNYSGSVHITIQPGGKVTWKDEIKV
jgi:hypothetical protein